MSRFYMRLLDILKQPILGHGDGAITLGTIIATVALFIGLVFVIRKLRRWIVSGLLARSRLDTGARQAAGAVFSYSAIAIGTMLILQTVGINLTTLNVVAGAVGVGVGFGLQNVASNFISGLIILFERPIKVGDRIVVANVEGDVVQIGARSTTVVTNDNISIIVPNAKLITENVINWTHADSKVRFTISVRTSYKDDPKLVARILREVAEANSDVLTEPAPAVRLAGFGDYGMDFELRAWSSTLVHNKGLLTSDLNFAIYQAFMGNGVEFPYPTSTVQFTQAPK